MKKQAILSAVGRDRIGVADDLAAMLAERRIGIQDSRMTALRGRFALIVQVDGEPEDVANLERELALLRSRLGFELQLEPVEALRPAVRTTRYRVESYSRGPGGVAAVTGVLKRHGINIEDLETDAAPAPFTSALTFHMKARITVPESCSITRVEEDLRELERNDRNLDIVLRRRPALVPEGDLATTGT